MFSNANNAQLARVEQILRQLDSAPKNEPASNRRRASRHHLRAAFDTVVLGAGGDTTMEIFSRNLSSSGIGFVSRRLCKPGERLVISLEFAEKRRKLVLAQITFCSYFRAGLYQVGAEFLDAISSTGEAPHIPPHWNCGSQPKAAIVLPTPPQPVAPAPAR